MLLNSEGKRLLHYTEEILAKYDEMLLSFTDTSNPAGLLEIGIVETIIGLPRLLASYYNQFPNVELTLKTGVTEELLQDVIKMNSNGAFVTGPIRHPLIKQVEVFQEKLVLVSKNDTFSLEDITMEPLLLYNKGCGYRERLESWLKAEGILPKKIMEFGTFETIIGSVAAGIGLTIIPLSSVTSLVANGTICIHPVPEPYNEVKTVFIYHKDAYLTNTLQSFINEIADHTTKTSSAD